MSNPRKVNWLQDPAFTAPEDGTVPAIPDLHSDDREHQAYYVAVKQNIEVLRGVPNLPGERAARMRDLQELGLTGNHGPEGALPQDMGGIPVWAGGTRRFELVTPEALAAALTEFITFDSEITLEEFRLLREAVAAINPGVTQDQLQGQLQLLAGQLARAWRHEIAAALQPIDKRLTALENSESTTWVELNRAVNGLLFEITVAASVWTITHNLGRYVDVTVLDDDGEKRLSKVVYDSVNQLTITHSTARTGKVLVK